MAHTTLIIDGHTEIDDDLDASDWQRRPPELLADMIKPGARPQPYLAGAAMALAEAAIKNQPIRITIQTRAAGWTLTVDHVQLSVEGRHVCGS